MRLVPLSSQEIAINEPLPWPVYDRTGMLLLKKGFVIVSQGQLRGLLDRGFLDGDVLEKPRNRDDELPVKRESLIFGPVRAIARRLSELHRELLRGEVADLPLQLVKMAQELREALDRDTDLVLASLQLDAADNDFSGRHLHAAALSDLIARAVDFSDAQRLSLVCAGLSFDIGFSQLHLHMDKQAGPLSSEQLADLYEHPDQSVTVLDRAGVADDLWLKVVAQHHERIDGSGYPQGLVGESIEQAARILAIADTYSAMIRPRAYRPPLQSRQALRDIFLERGKRIDDALAAAFIKEIGVYPPGTFVQLANGETAIVTRRRKGTTTPHLRCLIGSAGIALQRALPRDCRLPAQAITTIVDPLRMQAHLPTIEQLWADGPGETAGEA